MTPEQKAAYIMAMAACAMAETAGMLAANWQALCEDAETVPFDKAAFEEVITRNGIHHNQVHSFFHGL
jgi:hypothetical protein